MKPLKFWRGLMLAIPIGLLLWALIFGSAYLIALALFGGEV